LSNSPDLIHNVNRSALVKARRPKSESFLRGKRYESTPNHASNVAKREEPLVTLHDATRVSTRDGIATEATVRNAVADVGRNEGTKRSELVDHSILQEILCE
jgi:hypothetical protein